MVPATAPRDRMPVRASRDAGVAQRTCGSRIRLRDQARPLGHRAALADEQARDADGGSRRPSPSLLCQNRHVALLLRRQRLCEADQVLRTHAHDTLARSIDVATSMNAMEMTIGRAASSLILALDRRLAA